MKFKVRLSRRHNMYFTLFACGASLWLMVTRFGLDVQRLLVFAVISIALLLTLIAGAALLGYVVRKVNDERE